MAFKRKILVVANQTLAGALTIARGEPGIGRPETKAPKREDDLDIPDESGIRLQMARLERLDQEPEEMIGAAKERFQRRDRGLDRRFFLGAQ